MRTCLNFDLISGVDDDDATIHITPALHLEAHGGAMAKTKEEATPNQGAFTEADVGRRLTVVTKTRKVFVDGVERRVKWSRRVERTGSDEDQKGGREWRKKGGFNTKWVEWPAIDMVDAEIRHVEESVDGLVRVLKDSMTAKADGSKNRIPYSLKNPEIAAARLGVLDIGAGTFEGKGKGCLLYTSRSPRDATLSRMPSSA